MNTTTKLCPILEQTADGINVGRCYFYTGDTGICPRHGDISKELQTYNHTGQLTLESTFRSSR